MGPWWFLGGFVFGVALNVNRMIGDVSCAWRVSYSPRGPAFGIWGVIYLWTFASIVLQLLHGYTAPTYIGEPQSNYLIGGAWALTGVWGQTFGRGDDGDRPGFIGLAAFVLIASAMLALGAVGIEQSWRSQDVWRTLGVGVPYSLFAGWLTVAATVNVGIAVMAVTTPPDPRCRRDAYGDRPYDRLLESEAVDTRAASSWVPLGVAVAVSIGSFLFPDPVLVLPALWGIYFMQRHLKNWIAMEVLVVTCAASAVQVATARWVIKEVI